jgi:DNA polymerase III subunit gamma/tau
VANSQTEPRSEQQSLYRRRRPRTFADVVGQEAVVRTLRHAVERERVHHAYLFVGSRGTGKTSMAKILAACLNCDRDPTHPTVEPCGECESCRSIAQARSLDVIEMDAASNNSVDDIRDLRESVAYAPVSGRRKVYILDEAHMLSTAAWNAFLKTLEEPPPSTVFVLATTEAQKVPATVVDRCHRFDFHRPTVEQIAGVVRGAAAAESIELPPEAAVAVARAATGSFRDALGILEQLITYSDGKILVEDVLAVLGVTEAQLLEETIEAVHSGDARRVLLAVARCAEGGRDAVAFASDLEVRARELLVVATLGEVPVELSLAAEADGRLAAQAARVGQGPVVRLLEQLGRALEAIKAGGDPRTQLELALVKAARPEVDVSLRALLDRIERLEAGGVRPAPAIEGGPPQAAPAAFEVGSPGPAGEATAADSPGPEERAAAAEPMPATPVQTAGEAPVGDDIAELDALWPAVVELVGAENKLLRAVLCDARPVAVDEGQVRVAFASSASFLKKKAEDPAHRATVGEALRELTGGRRLRVEYELRDELPPPVDGGRGEAPRTEDEWVARFVEEFDAEELHEDERAPANGAGEPASEIAIGE